MKESRRITPLRTILRNCLNHIENLETNRSICDNYDKEFQDLKQFSETLKIQKDFSCTEGEKEVNKKKNRYKDILPFNVSRVVLSEYAGIPGSDYINANFIRGASGSPAYIASQGPLPNTVNDFWRMVVECEVQVIVMACNAQESGKHKCENYWVEKEGEEKKFGMVQICLVKASTVCPDFLVRTMRLKYTNDKDVTEERTVCQFHYSAWPDHGVPPLVRPLLDMVRLVRDTQASETLPVLVHCSAGCGRTGTICAIDFVWGLLRAGKLTEEFSLFNLVRDMRKQRVAMVQTKEQYILVHQAVRELFKEQLQVIESHPYENIDFNGVPLIKDFEEPFYDTISIQKEENCDEKQDKSEVKEKGEDAEGKVSRVDSAPPLPRKKRPNVLFSKQEKEAENFTEKNRSSFAEKDKTDASLSSLLGKPRIVKLRALFEKSPTAKDRSALKDRGSQTVSRSHSLGAIRKPLVAEAFDSQAEKSKPNRANQQSSSESVKLKNSKSFSKSVPLIKRSKSLKTFSQTSQLSLSPSMEGIDRGRSVKTHLGKANQDGETGWGKATEIQWKKPPAEIVFPGRDWEIGKESRRRSLESLMGDVPPPITWPKAVMAEEPEEVTPKGRPKSDRSRKTNSPAIRGSKTIESIGQQLQRLTVETEKKLNRHHFPSGIGTRERRNSFRQAVSKNEFKQNAFRNIRDPPPSAAKNPPGNDSHYYGAPKPECSPKAGTGNPPNGPEKPTILLLEREGTLDVKLSTMIKSKSVPFEDRNYSLIESVSGSSAVPSGRKANGRHPIPENSASFRNVKPVAAAAAVNQISAVLDPRLRKVVPNLKMAVRMAGEELERSPESKNLFLKKLNSEILNSERDGSSRKRTESRHKSNCEEPEKPAAVAATVAATAATAAVVTDRVRSNLMGVSNDPKRSDCFDEPDGSEGRSLRSVEFESGKILRRHPANSNVRGKNQNSGGKVQKPSKSAEEFRNHSLAVSNPAGFCSRENLQRMRIPHQGSPGEFGGSADSRREELQQQQQQHRQPQEIRHGESFFSFPPRKSKNVLQPAKSCPIRDPPELPLSQPGRRRDPAGILLGSDLYPLSIEENPDKQFPVSAVKSANPERGIKNFDCPPWSPSVSSRSSGEASSSDQHSSKSDSSRFPGGLHESDRSVSRPEAKIFPKSDHYKRTGDKFRPNDSSGTGRENLELSNGSGNQRRPEAKSNGGDLDFGSRGAVTSAVKSRPDPARYAKDDFLVEVEPTAPPRVKRHASVTIPRNNLVSPDGVSQWAVPAGKRSGPAERNAILEADQSAWTGSFGVDLDAVAASMQQQQAKGESSAAKSSVWPGKTSCSFSSAKKKQHYF